MSVKHGMSEKISLSNCDPGTAENGSNFKWIKSSLGEMLSADFTLLESSTETRSQLPDLGYDVFLHLTPYINNIRLVDKLT